MNRLDNAIGPRRLYGRAFPFTIRFICNHWCRHCGTSQSESAWVLCKPMIAMVGNTVTPNISGATGLDGPANGQGQTRPDTRAYPSAVETSRSGDIELVRAGQRFWQVVLHGRRPLRPGRYDAKSPHAPPLLPPPPRPRADDRRLAAGSLQKVAIRQLRGPSELAADRESARGWCEERL